LANKAQLRMTSSKCRSWVWLIEQDTQWMSFLKSYSTVAILEHQGRPRQTQILHGLMQYFRL
jgi:hypothetical protein